MRLRACAKTSAGQEAYFQQNDPHPAPLPSDGRGNSQTCRSQLPKRLDTPTDGGRFSLSHPMGEGVRVISPQNPNLFLHEFLTAFAAQAVRRAGSVPRRLGFRPAGTTDDPARFGAGVFPIFQDLNAIHKDVANAACILVRPLISRVVLNSSRVEDD